MVSKVAGVPAPPLRPFTSYRTSGVTYDHTICNSGNQRSQQLPLSWTEFRSSPPSFLFRGPRSPPNCCFARVSFPCPTALPRSIHLSYATRPHHSLGLLHNTTSFLTKPRRIQPLFHFARRLADTCVWVLLHGPLLIATLSKTQYPHCAGYVSAPLYNLPQLSATGSPVRHASSPALSGGAVLACSDS